MRLNERQWNVTKNDLFLRNKSEAHKHTHIRHSLYLFIYYSFGGGAIITVAVAFHSLLFAIGVFGVQFNELLVFYRAATAAATVAALAEPHHLPFSVCMYTSINFWPEAIYSAFIVW